ncbi:MAG: hypothetical protein GXX08_09990 [Firmicutes bacterium]|nr:hypothetical protein [Bacillota bacterium]
MIATVGSWVYVLSVALVVVAFIELLMPRTATSGLARVVIGLCVIALLFDIVLGLAAEDFSFDLEFGVTDAAGLAAGDDYLLAGEALVHGTLAAVHSQLSGLAGEEGAAPSASTVSASSGGLSRVGAITVETIAQVKVGGSRD